MYIYIYIYVCVYTISKRKGQFEAGNAHAISISKSTLKIYI